jgi:hypothetical protein
MFWRGSFDRRPDVESVGLAALWSANLMSASAGRNDPAEFATFWHGPLNPIAYSCLASFPNVGAPLRLYSYDDRLDLPPGVELADARGICPDETLLSRYVVGGKPSIAMFADMFRYRLIRDFGCCWVDADLICLRRPDFVDEAIVFGRQAEAHGKALINNAVLRLPRDHPLLEELLARAEAALDIEQSWGAIGPFLLTDLAEKYGLDARAHDVSDFYPVDADNFWRPLLPTYRAAVGKAAERATFLHLWSEMFERAAYDKSACPPAGSFLHDAFGRLGTLDRFSRVYEASELTAVLSKWIGKEDRQAERTSN